MNTTDWMAATGDYRVTKPMGRTRPRRVRVAMKPPVISALMREAREATIRNALRKLVRIRGPAARAERKRFAAELKALWGL
jgi:hypothetical protein